MAALAFEHFARQSVDIAVIETGLGGRLDATNVLRPALTIITDISFDHAEILGSSLAEIASEKAGILKPGVPCVTGRLAAPAARVISRTGTKLGAKIFPLTASRFKINEKKQTLSFDATGLRLADLRPNLYGSHQLRNSALVLSAIHRLRLDGLSIPKVAIVRGLKSVNWPGRFQVVKSGFGPATVILDVCHNPGGVAAFVDTFSREFPGRKADIIIGLVKRKPHQEIIARLAPIAAKFWLVGMATGRSVKVRQLAAEIDWQGVPLQTAARLSTVYQRVAATVDKKNLVAVIGSHYLVGEYLARYAPK